MSDSLVITDLPLSLLFCSLLIKALIILKQLIIEIIRLRKTTDKYFDDFKRIYTQSFPKHEQRTDEQHLYALAQDRCHIAIYVVNEGVVAFIVYWDFTNYIYIEHLAITPIHRGQNYGTIILSQFIKANPKTVILEIDPLVDELSIKRFEFYKRIGFIKNSYNHKHPAYRKEFTAHQLIVLSVSTTLSCEQYDQFVLDLKSVVMNS